MSALILVIDDDEAIRESVEAVLVAARYRVLTAGDGAVGIELAQRHLPDLIVSDMMMPNKSGFLVLEHVKKSLAPAPKVVIITANEGEHHRDYAESLGADAYLRKPFGLAELVRQIQILLSPA